MVVVVEVVAVVTEEVDEAAEEDTTVLATVVDCGSSVVVAVDGEVVDIAVEIDCEGTADVRTDPVGWMLVEFTDIVSLHITGNACGHDGSFGKKHISVEFSDFQYRPKQTDLVSQNLQYEE